MLITGRCKHCNWKFSFIKIAKRKSDCLLFSSTSIQTIRKQKIVSILSHGSLSSQPRFKSDSFVRSSYQNQHVRQLLLSFKSYNMCANQAKVLFSNWHFHLWFLYSAISRVLFHFIAGDKKSPQPFLGQRHSFNWKARFFSNLSSFFGCPFCTD